MASARVPKRRDRARRFKIEELCSAGARNLLGCNCCALGGRLTRGLQRFRPPAELIEQRLRGRLQLGEFRDRLAFAQRGHEVAAGQMHARPCRRHLQFDADESELLDRSRRAYRAIAEKGRRLLVPLWVSIVEGVLENGGSAVIVFRGYENVAVILGYFLLPAHP